MAQGDSSLFNDFVLKMNKGEYQDTDTLTLAFLSDTIASINTDSTDPQLSDFTVTSGGNVAASYALANVAVTRAATITKIDADDIGSIAKDAANPADVRVAIIYNDTSVNDDAYTVFDLTADGTTPLDLVNNDFNFTFNANGIINATNTSA